MRKYKRAVARYRMRMDGLERVNRKNRRGKSFFAQNWRKYLQPTKTAKRKRLRVA